MKAIVALKDPKLQNMALRFEASVDGSWRVGGCRGESVTVYGENVHYI